MNYCKTFSSHIDIKLYHVHMIYRDYSTLIKKFWQFQHRNPFPGIPLMLSTPY